ncbi:MAG: bifunctional diaminohydroxyphosphoribosylaminopyrimidine deaminase/5-amino-6-(5-phosphoribosylamino)uracil reductase RibD [Clostridium sp.]
MDKKYMKLALELAKKGCGSVSPNPLVGAVIVKDNRIIGEGYHEIYGGNHAEVNAFTNSSESVDGATIYVTLEPCSHYGKTPPCVDKIIEKNISKVVIGTLDPNPIVSGCGMKKLRDAGINVEVGVLEEECIRINEIFMKYIVKKTPFVVMKIAMSLDGKIATSSGESKWISGEDSRRRVHELRGELSAIMVGVNTIIKDDAELTSRIEGSKNPIRIVVDSTLRIPIESRIIKSINKSRLIIATTNKATVERINILEEKGAEVLILKDKNGRVDLQELMINLGELQIDSILLEGGSILNYSALESSIVDKVQIYIAPKIIGGEQAKTPVSGEGVTLLKDAFKVRDLKTRFIGEDIFIEGYI